MFARIAGRLVERRGESAVIEAGGLGYEIVLPPCISEKVPATAGEPVTLEIYSVDRGLVAGLVSRLERRMEFDLSVSERNLYVSLDERTLSGMVEARRLTR